MISFTKKREGDKSKLLSEEFSPIKLKGGV
jgi:hypothetical protein